MHMHMRYKAFTECHSGLFEGMKMSRKMRDKFEKRFDIQSYVIHECFYKNQITRANFNDWEIFNVVSRCKVDFLQKVEFTKILRSL